MSDLRNLLLDVRARHGELTPNAVVADATPSSHPLHSRFEWDDAVAGHKYRLAQASELIRSVRVREVAGEPVNVRAFVSVTREQASPVYEPVEVVVADDFSRRLVLQQMRRDWEVFKQKYRDMEEFVALIRGEADAA